jgi:hypothetical protein
MTPAIIIPLACDRRQLVRELGSWSPPGRGTAFGVFALFGVMFALVQSFQAILRVDPQGSGFRLLPLVTGLIVGAASIP